MLFAGFMNSDIILADNTERLCHAVYSVVHVELQKNKQRIYIKLYFFLMRTENISILKFKAKFNYENIPL